ncbi:hypothetical protein BP00DRAFT_168177 [Aspergillus indologenus CBS 114.80]|uniref:Calcineurin-like phosphoesterase domain-containing protein n=1 Tax=Aspergillus indologenus CBS 114.80 TaxID=1450541 RepID=A0A2V5ICA8_9EURO|nr:hypothetical protein BP00DRAFT_168177 [Aspergillus indologenus CBS 114.80]
MDETRIQIISDLHLEAPAAYDIFSITPRAPFLALLGDVGYVQDEGFFDFLSKQLAAFRVVFLILGNHEPYHSSWTETKAKLESFGGKVRGASAGEAIGELVVLDQTRYDISPTVTILGCTLFSRVAQDQSDNVSFGLNDFYHIRNWSLESHQEAHRADLRWLNEEIDSISQKEPGRKIVVLTHYCPSISKNVVDPRHENSKLSSGFMTDLSKEICWRCEKVILWAFGHTHFNCDFRDPGTGKRVLSNQRGYYFSQSTGFDSEKTVEL